MINCACGLSAGSMSIFVWRIAAFCCFISSKISDRERPEYSILVLLHAWHQEYEEALKNDGYRVNLEYKNRDRIGTQGRRNRPRKILWFNPPYNMEVVNNLGKEFFKILKINFPSGSQLHKIFNKNCIKLSYSCMPIINGIINRSNIAKLGTKKHKVIDKCNCRDKVRCPLEGKCKQECVVYKVEVYSDSNNKRDKKIYFGSTQGDFKTRYYNHRTSLSHERYRYSADLSS